MSFSDNLRAKKVQKEKASKRRTNKGSERSFSQIQDFSIIPNINEQTDDISDQLQCEFCSCFLTDKSIKLIGEVKCCKFCYKDALDIKNEIISKDNSK